MPQFNALSFENLIEFISVDLTPWNDDVYRFCNSNPYDVDLPELATKTFMGQEWLCLPFQFGGDQRGGENLVQPSVQVADFSGAFYVKLRTLGFAPGAIVTRYQGFDADVSANMPVGFPPTEYVLNVVNYEGGQVQLSLANHVDFAASKTPGFMMYREDYPGLGSALLRG